MCIINEVPVPTTLAQVTRSMHQVTPQWRRGDLARERGGAEGLRGPAESSIAVTHNCARLPLRVLCWALLRSAERNRRRGAGVARRAGWRRRTGWVTIRRCATQYILHCGVGVFERDGVSALRSCLRCWHSPGLIRSRALAFATPPALVLMRPTANSNSCGTLRSCVRVLFPAEWPPARIMRRKASR
jgi:hypothetical protein